MKKTVCPLTDYEVAIIRRLLLLDRRQDYPQTEAKNSLYRKFSDLDRMMNNGRL